MSLGDRLAAGLDSPNDNYKFDWLREQIFRKYGCRVDVAIGDRDYGRVPTLYIGSPFDVHLDFDYQSDTYDELFTLLNQSDYWLGKMAEVSRRRSVKRFGVPKRGISGRR